MLNDWDQDFSSGVEDETWRATNVEIGNTEIGNIEIGDFEIGNIEIGNTEIGNTEIGNIEIGAVEAVIRKARDNRQPSPRMRAVDVDAPFREETALELTDVFIGAAASTGNPDPFPLTSALLLRFGAGGEPRYVRIDTESSYKKFRRKHSPEMADFHQQVEDLRDRLSKHEADPYAHQGTLDEAAELTLLGEAAKMAEEAKAVELWLPPQYEGKIKAWCEGDFVCASMKLPGADGEVRICTSVEPIRRCVAEMARHASEAGVRAATIVGILPPMGVVLGAGTIVKEMAAAAPALLQRPEAAGTQPFVVRIEPKANPTLCALAALAVECRNNNQQACDEWQRIGRLSGSGPINQAMTEALQLVREATFH